MEPCCPACASCSRRSPPSSVKRTFPMLIIFPNPQWFAGLALLTDITTHLNNLNVKLQGKNILITDMYSHITAFEVKLAYGSLNWLLVSLYIFLVLLLMHLVTWTWTLVLMLSPLCGSNLSPVSQVLGHWFRVSSCSRPPLTSLWKKSQTNNKYHIFCREAYLWVVQNLHWKQNNIYEILPSVFFHNRRR